MKFLMNFFHLFRFNASGDRRRCRLKKQLSKEHEINIFPTLACF